MTNALVKAIAEEAQRRKASYQELKTLEYIVQEKALITTNKETLLSIVQADIDIIISLNEEIKNTTVQPALKFNKLKEIFSCTDQLLKDNFEAAQQGKLLEIFPIDYNSITILNGTRSDAGEIINYSGTSKANCIQNAYFIFLRAITEASSINEIFELKENNIYNVNTSYNIQTTKLPSTIHSESYKNWFYYYKDEASPEQGELLIPNLGYAFGGSRADPRYHSKLSREEDCSSAVAKWLNAETSFITLNMKSYFDNDPACSSNIDCQAVSKALDPVIDTSIYTSLKGLVFFFPGHTGVVSNHYPELNMIETLSYSRDMPHIEGLGYKNYTLTEKPFIFFSEKTLVSLSDFSTEL